MQKILKYSMVLGLIIAVTVCLSFFSLRYLITTDSVKNRLANLLSDKIGAKVELRQPLEIKFFPKFKASLSDVTIRSRNNNVVFNLFQAKKIDFDLSLWDAIFGKINFGEIKLTQPIVFCHAQTGNFIKQIFDNSEHNLNKKNIINIKQGEIYFGQEHIKNINGSISFINETNKADLNLTAVWHNTNVSLQSITSYIVSQQMLQFDKLKLNIVNNDISGVLQLLFKPNLQLVGSLDVSKLNLKQLLSASYLFGVKAKKIGVQLDLRFSVQKASFAKLTINDLAATLQSNEQGLILGVGRGQTPYGQIEGTLKLLKNKVPNKFTTDLQLMFHKADLAFWLQKLALPIKVSSNADVDLHMNISQLDEQELIKRFDLLFNKTNSEKFAYNLPLKMQAEVNFHVNKITIPNYGLIPALDQAKLSHKKIRLRRHKYTDITAPLEVSLAKQIKGEANLQDNDFKLILSDKSQAIQGETVIDGKKINFLMGYNFLKNSKQFVIRGKTDDGLIFWLLPNNDKLQLITMFQQGNTSEISKKLLANILTKYRKKEIYKDYLSILENN